MVNLSEKLSDLYIYKMNPPAHLLQQFKKANDIPDNKELSMRSEVRDGKLSVKYDRE